MAVLPLPVVAFSPPIPESRLLLVWRFCISKLSGTVPTDSLGEPTTTENTSDSGATIDRRRVPHDGGDLAEEDGMVDLVVVDNEDRPEEWKRRDGKEVKKDPEMDEKASSDRSSLYEPRQTRRDGYVTVCGKFLKGQLWPVLLNFFEPSYLKSETETAYQKEYRAKQRAQIAERKTMDGRKRFSNYIFHEVRVPLNTSLLALQNLKADGVFNAMLAEGQPHSIEYSAIESSLRMMSQVLNDVLDFSRMERGGFSSVSRPFSLHGVLRSIASPLRLEAAAAGLALETSFDSRIDEFANLAAFKKPQAGFGLLIGDEMRLRQVVNNLTSNATKFTSPGGKVSLSTKLVHPWPDILPSIEEQDSDEQVIVVRIEVTDTGVGIRSRDLHDGLFSAYVQTQIGLNQGGKGTGLGLSLVKQIVTNSGGRLGVRSQVGVGTTMWFELPFTVGRGTLKAEPIDLDEELAKGFKVNTPESYSDQKSEFDFPPPTPPAESQSLSGRTLVNTRPLVSGLFQSEGTSSGEERETSPSVSSSASPSTSQRSEIEHGIKPPLVTSASAPAPSSLVQPKKALSFEYGPVRALIVDDDNLTRKLMGRMVERLGCQVESAENGAIALDMILATEDEDNPNEEPKHFDIILLDNQMPICSGLQVVSKLRSLGRQDYIIGVTANAQLQDQEEFIREGASLVLTKPVREGDLRKVILLADQRRKPGGEE
ncbi:hypothetical protein P7C70_g8280, partial [Phenoliferia sp. Uapishka_3]